MKTTHSSGWGEGHSFWRYLSVTCCWRKRKGQGIIKFIKSCNSWEISAPTDQHFLSNSSFKCTKRNLSHVHYKEASGIWVSNLYKGHHCHTGQHNASIREYKSAGSECVCVCAWALFLVPFIPVCCTYVDASCQWGNPPRCKIITDTRNKAGFIWFTIEAALQEEEWVWEKEDQHRRKAAFIPALHCRGCSKLTIMELFSPIIIPCTSDDNCLIDRAAFCCSPVYISGLILYITITSPLFEHKKALTWRCQTLTTDRLLCPCKNVLISQTDTATHWKTTIS